MEAHEGVKRKLTAILYADVAGYSRLTGEDEEGTHRLLSAYLDVITATIEKHGGRTVHFAGDAVLADFSSVVDALACAVEAQRELRNRNEALPEERRVQFRIGINLGDVIVDREDIYGDGVNIAARLEGLAQPGGICISGAVYQQVRNKLELAFEFMGPQEVKNIAEPVPVFQVQLDPGAAGKRPDKGVRPPRWRSLALAAAVVLLVGAGAVAFWNFYPRSSAPPIDVASTAAPENAVPKLPDKPSIAILPFENMSDDPGQEHFSDGLTEDIITDLAQLEDLIVIARASVFTYKGKSVKVQQVARELGVQYVLEGSVRKSGDRVRITAQLVDGKTGHHLWAERYDRDLKDIFALQDEIAQKIRATLAGYAVKTAKGSAARDRYETIGTVVSVDPEKSRIVLDHGEIKDFMAPMVMSYVVTPATLLRGLAKGDKVRFTIDTDKRTIVGIVPVGK
ncbi:MAG: copper-binding protein [Alphaproteobacteria bacterium]|nr:copper-binding protein [Alphaproteobacteria bacterium]